MKKNSFRFKPLHSIDTDAAAAYDALHAKPRARKLLERLIKKKHELDDLLKKDQDVAKSSYNLQQNLRRFTDAKVDVEASLSIGLYNDIIGALYREPAVQAKVEQIVRDIRDLQMKIEPALAPSNPTDLDLDEDDDDDDDDLKVPGEESDVDYTYTPGTAGQGRRPPSIPVPSAPKGRGSQTKARKRMPTTTVEPEVVVQPSPAKKSAPQPEVGVQPSPATTAVPEPQIAAVSVSRPAANATLVTLARDINDVLERALQPMLSAVSAVAWKLGFQDARYLLLYRDDGPDSECGVTLPSSRLRIVDEDPGSPALQSMAEFKRRYEPLLGTTFLRSFLAQTLGDTSDLNLADLERKAAAAKPSASTTTAKKKSTSSGVVTLMEPIGSSSCFDFERDLAGPGVPAVNPEALSQLERLHREYPNDDDIARNLQRLRDGQAALRLFSLDKPESRYAPAWAFEVLNSAVFRAFVAPAGLAAFEMAHAHVRRIPGCSSFTMKELICSQGVADQFAFLVAHQYMDATKGLPVEKPTRTTGRSRSAYVNINQMRQMLMQRAYLCTIWFESVRATANSLVHEFEQYRARVRQQRYPGVGLPVAGEPVPDLNDPGRRAWEQRRDRAEWERRMDEYAQQLPRRELKYVGE